MTTRIALAPGLLLLVLLAAIVVTWFALGKRGRTVLLVLVVVCVAGMLLSFVSRPSHMAVSGSKVAFQSLDDGPRQYIQSNHRVTSLPIWSEGLDGQFAADVYPSLKAAALGLARQTVSDLEPYFSDPNNKHTIHVHGEPTEGQGLTQEAIDAFCGRLQESFGPQSLVLSAQAPLSRAAPNTVTVWLKQPRWPMPGTDAGAKLSVAIQDVTRNTLRTTEFVLKPWVDGFTKFVNQSADRVGRLKVARSNEACMDEGEAESQAVAHACAQVQTAISSLNGTLKENLTVDFSVTLQDLEQAEIVKDSFAQSFQGSVGKIWRHALLLDFDTKKLVELRQAKIRRSHRQHLTWARLGGSVLGLAFLIFVLYIFLNAATKGYYTVSLRVVAFLLILMLGAVLLTLA